jgi:hypothetical protein
MVGLGLCFSFFLFFVLISAGAPSTENDRISSSLTRFGHRSGRLSQSEFLIRQTIGAREIPKWEAAECRQDRVTVTAGTKIGQIANRRVLGGEPRLFCLRSHPGKAKLNIQQACRLSDLHILDLAAQTVSIPKS